MKFSKILNRSLFLVGLLIWLSVNSLKAADLLISVKVEDFGAKGDGKTDDTYAINKAVKYAALNNVNLIFKKSRLYLVDSVVLRGTNIRPYDNLMIIGNGAIIKSTDKGKMNLFSFYFVNNLKFHSLTIIGNKSHKINGNGVVIEHSKYVNISNSNISNFKFSGILIAWTSYASINNNIVHDNGDGTFPSDGITIHSLQEGTIFNNRIYNNNPLSNEDGDGIQIGNSSYDLKGYFDHNLLKNISVYGNVCYNHGRRGIKIQRSFVSVFDNYLYNNMFGILIARNEDIHNIFIVRNVILGDNTGIGTDGANINRISELIIKNNILIGNYSNAFLQMSDLKANSVNLADNIVCGNNGNSRILKLSNNSLNAIVNLKSKWTNLKSKNYFSLKTPGKAFPKITKANYELKYNIGNLILLDILKCKVILYKNMFSNNTQIVFYNPQNSNCKIELISDGSISFENGDVSRSIIIASKRAIILKINNSKISIIQ